MLLLEATPAGVLSLAASLTITFYGLLTFRKTSAICAIGLIIFVISVLSGRGLYRTYDHAWINYSAGFVAYTVASRYRLRPDTFDRLLLACLLGKFLAATMPISSYYSSYIAYGVMSVSITRYAGDSSGKSLLLAAASIFVVASGLTKASVFSLLSGLACLVTKKRITKFVMALALGLAGAFAAINLFQTWDSFESFYNARVSRSGFEHRDHTRFFGISDGNRVAIWSQQVEEGFRNAPFFGQGSAYAYARERVTNRIVTNHNFIVTLFCSTGLAGVLLAVIQVALSLRPTNQYFFWSTVPMLGLSLVGEGIFVPFLFVFVCFLSGLAEHATRVPHKKGPIGSQTKLDELGRIPVSSGSLCLR